MVDRQNRPRSQPQWMRAIEDDVRRLRASLANNVPTPIGAMLPLAGGATPPPGWLLANGSTFSATDYPFLAAQLGSTTLPNPGALGSAAYIIRAG